MCVEVGVNTDTADATLTAGTSDYTLSTLFPAAEVIRTLYVTPVGGTRTGPLVETSLDDIVARQRGTTSSDGDYPTHYTLLGADTLILWPTPSAAATLTGYYDGLPTALSANTDVPILHEPWVSKLLLHGPASDASTFQKDWDAAQWHAAQFEAWLGRYRTHLNRKKGTTTRQFRVVGATPFVPHDPSTDLGYV